MEIIQVTNKRDYKQFVQFPQELYFNDPLWVPPLWSDEYKLYNRKHNPILAHSDFMLHLAIQDNKIVGRNLVYVDHNFNSYYKAAIGFFGSFECIDNQSVAYALMTKAEQWLKARGMERIRGPIHPVAEKWGFLYQGFSSSPVFMAPYNPPYYNTLIVKCGYKKIKDLLAYEADAQKNYQLPQRFIGFAEKILQRRSNLSIRKFNFKRLSTDAEHIWRITNIAVSNLWGYVPLNLDELRDMVRKLKLVVDVDAIWFVEIDGNPVGYSLGFPDINLLLKKIKGRLFPWRFFTILMQKSKIRNYRLFGLAVLPEYHNLGFDVLLYVNLYNHLSKKKIRLEANYILEDNVKIRNALEKLELRLCKIYRVYEKKL